MLCHFLRTLKIVLLELMGNMVNYQSIPKIMHDQVSFLVNIHGLSKPLLI